MERKKKKFFQKQHGVVRRILSIALILAMVMTMGQGLTGSLLTVKAATPVNVTLHFVLPEGWNWTSPALQYWGGSDTQVSGEQSGPTEIPGWDGAEGYVMTSEGNRSYSITLKGDFTGFQFLDMDNPSSNTEGKGYDDKMTQYTGDTPQDLYYIKNDAWGWYTDAAGTTPIPELQGVAENVTVTMHFQKPADWNSVRVYMTGGSSWKAIPGYIYAGSDFFGAEVEADKTNAGWYSFTITMKNNQFNAIFHNGEGKQTGDIVLPAPLEESVEKWVTLTGETDKDGHHLYDMSDDTPTGWKASTSNAPVDPNADSTVVSPIVNEDRTVTINLDATGQYADEEAIHLMGTLKGTNWNPGVPMTKDTAKGLWTITTEVQTPGVYGYKFKIPAKGDDGWFVDPINSNMTGDGNSKVVIAGLEYKSVEVQREKETALPETLVLYDAEGNESNVPVTYTLKDAALEDDVTISNGNITVAPESTVKNIVLTAKDANNNTSEVTVSVVDKLYKYNVYYFDHNTEHMNPSTAEIHTWEVGGGDIGDLPFEELVELEDGNQWMKGTIKTAATSIGMIPKSKGDWNWQTSNHLFDNTDKKEECDIYIVYGDSQTYTEIPVIPEYRDRYVIVEFENPEDADDYEWNLFTWNSGFGNGTEIYPELMPDGTHSMTVPVADQDVDLLLSFCIRKCSERGKDDWADQDGKDYYINVPADQTVVKAKYVLRNGVTEVYPYNTGYEMDGDNNRIHFYYRDDDLFKACTLDTLDGNVQVVVNGGTPASMEYDAENQRFYYDYEGLTTGDYEYYYIVNGENVLDKFNSRTTEDGSASVLTYKKLNVGIAASVSNSTMDYNDNNVLSVEFTGDDSENITTEEIASIQADLSALGLGTINAEPELMRVTIACLYSTSAGEKTIPVEVKDVYGHTYTADVKVTVTERVKAAGDFDWDEAVIYFAVTDRFFDGNTSNNDAYGVGDYDTGDKGGSSYHGGDFAGLTQKLDYLRDLGVNTIWITPIVENITEDQHDDERDFATYGYHGYWASDFTKLNQHLGTVEEFRALLDAAHSRNMKIMVDVVINHAGYGTESYFNTILPGDVKMLRDETNTVSGSDVYSSDNMAGLPDFVTENAEVRNQLIQWQTDWMDKFDIDYYRVDTVKHVDSTTWSAFKNSLTAANPEFKMTGEYSGAGYASTAGMLGTGRMDALLDFDFNGWAEDFVTGKVTNIEQNLLNRNGAINNTSTMSSFLSSHDEDTLQALLMNEKKLSAEEAYNLMKVAATLQITAKGQPVIYYGEEIGQAGENNWPYQTNRRDFDWAELEKQKSDPNSIFNHYKTMLAIRNAYTDVFARGTRTTIEASDDGGYDIMSRSYGDVTLYVGMNIKDAAKEVTIPVNAAAGSAFTDLYSGKQYTVSADKKVAVTIPAAKDGGTVVLVAEKAQDVVVPGKPTPEDPTPEKPTPEKPTPEKPANNNGYDGWAGVSPEQKAKLMQASLAQNAAVTAPKTNDNAPIAMVIMLMMAGAVAVAGAVGKKRKLG